MAKQKMIDSHIHLWPPETSNESGHAWMTPGNPLAKPHLLEHYLKASRQNEDPSSDVEVEGVIYVETDVRNDHSRWGDGVEMWAKAPLDEISFLRTIVDGDYGERASDMLLGIVPWAPMDKDPSVLREYLRLAEERAGPKCWSRVKGFRFLLQFISDARVFQNTVSGPDFQINLKELGRRGFAFDVGVDQRSGGVHQLESMAIAMDEAHRYVPENEKVTFIINHLCKPAFGERQLIFEEWRIMVSMMSKLSKTYMKFSGAFSEIPKSFGKDADGIAKAIKPWFMHLKLCFGTQRIMFGSDWPVCNVHGPRGEDSWVAWKDVVAALAADEQCGLSSEDVERLWHGVAREAYGISKP
ncbi:L-rhamnono-gamma-lactonase [Saxophila tyrrhenica]|uniref:L-rhamnono-gamma-lactonase n=1 Tax=Saxophila tyrrhenica TaxID=1690608 RepID=A0AAV9PFQ9_9PEZI|nr:L-rhamnono-gamma-lactonase [Saxophila tyrrhenica]